MEHEDKLIRKLLHEEFLEQAPAGFTDRVMQAITVAETREQTTFQWNRLVYPAISFGSIIIALGAIYFMDPLFYSRLYSSATGYVMLIGSQLISMFASLSRPEFQLPVNWFAVGIAFCLASLLLAERMIVKIKGSLNLFFV